MKDEPLVSVVIATYNMGLYLPEAVRSVLGQTWRNFELIVIDDGSEDDTEAQIQPCLNDSRLRYIRQENQGQPRAKNAGISEAKGDFIAFCDADDLWAPDKLAVQIPAFADPEVGVVYSEVNYMDENGHIIDKEAVEGRYSGTVTNHLVLSNIVPFGTAVIRRECVERDGVFDETLPMGIDWDLWLRYSVNWKFQYIPQETYTYRVWSGQMSNNYRGRYENAALILDKFISANPQLLSPKLISRAWSDIYVSKAMHIASAERTIFEPLRYLFLALKYDFGYWPVWRALIKFGIRRL